MMQALGLIETRGLLPAIECADVMLKTAQVDLVDRIKVGGGLVTVMVMGDVGAVKAAVEAGAAAVKKINPQSLVSQHVIPRPHEELEGLLVKPQKPAEPVQGERVPVQQREETSFLTARGSLSEGKESLADQEIDPNRIELAAEASTEKNPRGTEVQGGDKSSAPAENEITQQDPKAKDLDHAPNLEEKPNSTGQVTLRGSHKEQVDAVVKEWGLEKALEALQLLSVPKLRTLAREYKELGLVGRAISKANKELLIEKFKQYYERGN